MIPASLPQFAPKRHLNMGVRDDVRRAARGPTELGGDRVVAPWLSDVDVRWLAVAARGSDTRSRLVAVAAFADIQHAEASNVECSLVGGLFDPSDDVVIQAIAATGARGLAHEGPKSVAPNQIRRLFETARRPIRREIVVSARKRADLGLSEIVHAAATDVAWTVATRGSGSSGART
jgi:hypothetical protein